MGGNNENKTVASLESVSIRFKVYIWVHFNVYFVIFTKENNFAGFLFAFLDNISVRKCVF